MKSILAGVKVYWNLCDTHWPTSNFCTALYTISGGPRNYRKGETV